MTTALFIVSALVTWLLLFPISALLRQSEVIDRPTARSSHTVPTVRGAGVAIVVVVALAVGWMMQTGDPLFVTGNSEGRPGESSSVIRSSGTTLTVLLAAFLVLAVISFIDDMRGLPAKLRFGVHAAVSVAAVWAVFPNNEQPITITAIGMGALAVIWISGYTNAFNFMDGINGIAGMQALFTGLGTAAIAVKLGVPTTHAAVVLALVTAGAALGFLPHNFPRARVFMGDVSSAPLGFLLATLAFWIAGLTSHWVLFWIALLHANFVLDCGITLVRRALRGDKLHEAHREHFYQRLVRAGWSHTSVTLIEGGLQAVVALALWGATNAAGGVKFAVGAGVVLVWIAFFGFAERVFRRSAAGIADAEMLAQRRGNRLS